MQKLTKEQAIVITGFTGVMACNSFSDFHEDVEKRLGRPVYTHEFANKELTNLVKQIYTDDFMEMVS